MQQQPTLSFKETIDHQKDWFESQVLAACCKSGTFFATFKNTICTHPTDPRKLQEDFSYPVDNLLFRINKQYRVMVAGHQGLDVLPAQYVYITLQAMAAVGEIMQEEIDVAWQRLQFLLAQPVESVLPLLEQNVGYWLSKRRVHRVMLRTAADEKDWNPEDVAREISQANEVQRTAGGTQIAHEFGTGWARGDLNIQRMQTGIRKFDLMIGGGLGFKEMALFIMPSGAGKTVTACQLGATFALNGYEGILISTEQSHDQLEPRIVSNCCSIPFDIIKDGIFPEKLGDKAPLLKKLEESISKKLLIVDWGGQGKSLATDLHDEVRSYREKRGRPAQFLIVDWIGGGLGQMTQQQMAYFRLIYQQSADAIATVAEKENLVGVAMIQANTVQGKNNIRIDSACIAECKTAGQKATVVVGGSALQQNVTEMENLGSAPYLDKQYWYISKARKGTGGLVAVKRNFAFQRFENWN